MHARASKKSSCEPSFSSLDHSHFPKTFLHLSTTENNASVHKEIKNKAKETQSKGLNPLRAARVKQSKMTPSDKQHQGLRTVISSMVFNFTESSSFS